MNGQEAESMTTEVHGWLENCRRSCDMTVEEIPWRRSQEWEFDGHRLRHRSSGFFRVVGATVHFLGERQNRFDQPLIDQPEIGILGFLIRRTKGMTEILVQAKPEPGNVGLVQAAPTVQATRSNYTRIHRGRETLYLEHFLGNRNAIIVSDCVQSEQGTRFLSKYNRNMLVEPADGASILERSHFRWFPFRDFQTLLIRDFEINTDARSVLACGPWAPISPWDGAFARWRNRGGLGEAFLRSYETPEEKSACSSGEITARLNGLRSRGRFETLVVGISELADWEMTENAIRSSTGRSLEVRQYGVESSEREVNRWDQPLMTSREQGRAILLCQEVEGVLHFLFNCRAEIGFRECFEYGPTIQVPDGDPYLLSSLQEKEFELMELEKRSTALLSIRQSDEGGRFYRCVSQYGIRLLDPGEAVSRDPSLSWFTLRQIERFVQQPGFFSNEARSLISMLLAYL